MHRAKRILCPTDFSRHSRFALRRAAAMARASGAELVLFHVLHQPTLGGPNGDSYPLILPNWQEVLRLQQGEARAALEREARSRLLAGVRVRTTLGAGSPYQEIVRLASRMRVDLIVISTHGTTGLLHVMLGSVAERVVRLAPCPVLVIKPPRVRRARAG